MRRDGCDAFFFFPFLFERERSLVGAGAFRLFVMGLHVVGSK